MASETLQKFALELKTLREEKGVSLTQISNRTKIDIKFLHAIEEAKFEILPELYIRAFIKEYAQTIDVNPKSILSKFDIARSGKEEIVQKDIPQKDALPEEENSVIKKTIVQPEKIITKESESFSRSPVDPIENNLASKTQSGIKLNYILGGIVLLVAVVIAYFTFIQDQSDKIITNDQVAEVTDSNKSRYEVIQPAQNQKDSTAQTQVNQNSQPEVAAQIAQPVLKSDSLQLSVQINNRVWVKIYSDGKVVFQQMVEKGTNIKYRAKNRFSVSVGDAGAVKIFYENKLVPNIGKKGESKNIYMAPDGIRYYTISSNASNEKKSTSTH